MEPVLIRSTVIIADVFHSSFSCPLLFSFRMITVLMRVYAALPSCQAVVRDRVVQHGKSLGTICSGKKNQICARVCMRSTGQFGKRLANKNLANRIQHRNYCFKNARTYTTASVLRSSSVTSACRVFPIPVVCAGVDKFFAVTGEIKMCNFERPTHKHNTAK